jgi:NADH:ubiquinone oxidoreductase subunit
MDISIRRASSGRVRRVDGILFAMLAQFSVASMGWAAWTPERLDAATEYMQHYRKSWTRADTDALVANGPDHAVSTPGSVTGSIDDDNWRRVPVVVTGDSILVNGKDISGNLGSKTTHGTNSPIIENVRDSQVATGQGSSATNNTTSNVTVNVSLSIALSFSVVLNLYLLLRLRRRRLSEPSTREAKAELT